MMQDNGSVGKNVKYRNLCKEQFTVHVAYIHQSEWFEIENNSMVDIYKQAENGLQSRSSENGNTAVWHYGLKLQ